MRQKRVRLNEWIGLMASINYGQDKQPASDLNLNNFPKQDNWSLLIPWDRFLHVLDCKSNSSPLTILEILGD